MAKEPYNASAASRAAAIAPKAQRERFTDEPLVAVRMGEYPKGVIRKVGEKFRYTGVAPSWAVKEAEYKPKKPQPLNGDTKPPEAVAAVRRKAQEAAGDDLAGK